MRRPRVYNFIDDHGNFTLECTTLIFNISAMYIHKVDMESQHGAYRQVRLPPLRSDYDDDDYGDREYAAALSEWARKNLYKSLIWTQDESDAQENLQRIVDMEITMDPESNFGISNHFECPIFHVRHIERMEEYDGRIENFVKVRSSGYIITPVLPAESKCISHISILEQNKFIETQKKRSLKDMLQRFREREDCYYGNDEPLHPRELLSRRTATAACTGERKSQKSSGAAGAAGAAGVTKSRVRQLQRSPDVGAAGGGSNPEPRFAPNRLYYTEREALTAAQIAARTPAQRRKIRKESEYSPGSCVALPEGQCKVEPNCLWAKKKQGGGYCRQRPRASEKLDYNLPTDIVWELIEDADGDE